MTPSEDIVTTGTALPRTERWHGLVLVALRHERLLFWVPAGLCLAVLFVSFVFDPVVNYLDWRDYWVHAAVLHEWAADPLLAPHNPHYVSDAPSREYTPWSLIFVLLMRATGVSQFAALQVAACLGSLLMYLGIYRFFTTFFGTRVAAALGLIAAFFLWGNVWEFVGFFNYRSQLYNNYYPAAAAIGMVLLLWTLILHALRNPRPWHAIAIAGLFAFLMISHQLSGGYALGGAVLLIAFEPNTALARRVTAAAALVGGAALSALWPIYDPWSVVALATQSDPDWAPPPQFDRLSAVLPFAAPQLLGLAGLLHPRFARRMLPITIGFAGCFGVFLLGIVTGNSMTHRFLPFATLFLSMGLVCFWLGLMPVRLGWVTPLDVKLRRPAIAASLGLAVLCIGAQTGDVARDYYHLWFLPRDPVRAMFAMVSAQIPAGDVSIATPGVALSLNAFGDKVVAIPRGLFTVPDERERRADAKRFFKDASEAERRAIIARYGVRHIVFRTGRFEGAWWHDELPDTTVAALRRLGRDHDLPYRFVIVDVD